MKKLATTESSPLIVRGMENLLADLEGDLEFLIAGTEAANGVNSGQFRQERHQSKS